MVTHGLNLKGHELFGISNLLIKIEIQPINLKSLKVLH